MIYNFPHKVLIGAPIHEYKDYVIRKWLKYVCTELTYPGHMYKVLVVDNSPDPKWHKEFIDLYPNLEIMRYQKPKDSEMTVQQVLAECQNKIVNYAKRNRYSHFFSHECDNMCEEQPDVIERLLAHGLPVVGGFYQHGFGGNRYHMIQKMNNPIDITRLVSNKYRLLDHMESVTMINGKLQEIGNIGIGCTMIEMWIFDLLKFHSDEQGQGLSDSYFFADLINLLGINAMCDTSINVTHYNDSWGYKSVIESFQGRKLME